MCTGIDIVCAANGDENAVVIGTPFGVPMISERKETLTLSKVIQPSLASEIASKSRFNFEKLNFDSAWRFTFEKKHRKLLEIASELVYGC